MLGCAVSGYRVSLDAFEGPLDLLLHLVKHDEVDLYDISLERLTGQYLAFLDQARELDIPVAGEFIVMAATLMYLKSRELLPKPIQPPEEAPEEDDPRWDLIRQLLEYKKFKEIAGQLSEAEALRFRRYSPPFLLPSWTPAEGAAGLDLQLADLAAAFERVLSRAAARSTPGQISDERWTVAEKIETLRQRLPAGQKTPFHALFQRGAPREELIVTFLAILELMKIRELQVSQRDFLGDIELLRL